MGRSSKEQSVISRRHIVENASRLFRANGIDNVSISDVMKATGMTSGGFYKHFESKEALAAEAADLAFTDASNNWQKIQTSGQNISASQADIASYYLTPVSGKQRCPIISLGSDIRQSDDGDLKACYTKGLKSLLESFIKAGGSEGLNSASERDLALFAAMIGASYLNEVIADRGLAEQFTKAVQQLITVAEQGS